MPLNGKMSVRLLLALCCVEILQIAHLTAGLPNGAPLSACKKMKPLHKYHPQYRKTYFFVVIKDKYYLPGKTINVTITGRKYRGFMLQARKTFTRMAFGKWQQPDEHAQLLNCFDKEGSALTHTNARNAVSNVTYVWMAPTSLCLPSITFEATVAEFFTIFWRALESDRLPRDPSVTCTEGVSRSGKFTYRIYIMIVTLCFHLVTIDNYR